ncbi:hypothetical protein [uncultured Cytophaga sp.]|uniref:hypothetical protein n=1 Tax=uncultured Cytophaga sp. TaxID=160238 RepID=UPI00262DF6AE|nr:hypothetical protein [uncultured Cytophaga sp.]
MKNVFILFLTIVLVGQSFAQHDTLKNPTVPKEITSSFNKAHPNAKLVNWSRTNGTYIATFKEGTSTLWTTYDNTGLLLENKWKVTSAELPEMIRDSIPESKANPAQIIYKRTDAKGFVSYEINSPNKKVIYNSFGEHVSTTEMIKRK